MGVKISNLPAIVTPAVSDEIAVVQSGITYSETITQLGTLLALLNDDVTFTSVTFSPTTKGIVGTTTNDDAAASYVGEFMNSDVNTVAITTATDTDVTSLSLTAGDWDVWGNILTEPAATTTQTIVSCGITTTSATMPSNYSISAATFAASTAKSENAPTVRMSLSATTTVYLVANVTYATSTLTIAGSLNARRVR